MLPRAGVKLPLLAPFNPHAPPVHLLRVSEAQLRGDAAPIVVAESSSACKWYPVPPTATHLSFRTPSENGFLSATTCVVA